jgi:hypothetical protein
VRASGAVHQALVAAFFRGAENGYPVGRRSQARVQVWFDPKAHLVRIRGRTAGFPLGDGAMRCTCPFTVPQLLFERYWPVDTAEFVRRPGLGTFHGRDVIWLGRLVHTFRPGYHDGEWIALDPRTHDTVAWRTYGTTDNPIGQILGEAWVVKRFADIPANRFWFALKDELDVRLFRLQPIPLDVPGREPPRDLRHAGGIVVGQVAGVTVFAAPRSDGSWRLFSVGRLGRLGGRPVVAGPNTLRIGVLQRGSGGLFTRRAYLVVAGNMLEQRGTKLFVVYADGSRERLEPTLVHRPVGNGLSYYVVPRLRATRGRRPTGFQVVRGSRVIARAPLPWSPQGSQQPGPQALQTALRVLGL